MYKHRVYGKTCGVALCEGGGGCVRGADNREKAGEGQK